MKLSVTKTLCDGPTLRQKAVGMPGGSTRTILDVHVRKGIDEIDRAFGRVGVETVVEGRRQPSRDDRGAREAMVPGDRHALLIETGRDPVEPIGPVHVVLDVFLAGPDDFHRAVDMLAI